MSLLLTSLLSHLLADIACVSPASPSQISESPLLTLHTPHTWPLFPFSIYTQLSDVPHLITLLSEWHLSCPCITDSFCKGSSSKSSLPQTHLLTISTRACSHIHYPDSFPSWHFVLFETRTPHGTQVRLELAVLLPLPLGLQACITIPGYCVEFDNEEYFWKHIIYFTKETCPGSKNQTTP